MDVEVDQSWKIEQTSRATALAFSDGMEYAILIPAAAKKEAISVLRSRGKGGKRLYTHLFAAALYHLLKEHLGRLGRIVIDREYEGREGAIKLALLNWIWATHPGFPADAVSFGYVGKQSRAHKRALAVYRGKAQANRVLTARDLVEPVRTKK